MIFMVLMILTNLLIFYFLLHYGIIYPEQETQQQENLKQETIFP